MNFLCENHITEVERAGCFAILQLCVVCIVNLTESFPISVLCWLLSLINQKQFLVIIAFINSKAVIVVILQ